MGLLTLMFTVPPEHNVVGSPVLIAATAAVAALTDTLLVYREHPLAVSLQRYKPAVVAT